MLASVAGGRAEEDAVLLARVAAGDARAFATIYEMHRRPLYRLAYGVLLDPEEAREAVQEAFLRLHRVAATWQPQAAVGTWLYRVVLNHCLGLRQRLLRLARPWLAQRSPRTPEAELVLDEAMAVVEDAMGRLPLRQRAVASLFLESELTPSEIAPLLDMTPNTARVTLHRALRELRAALEAKGIDATIDEEEVSEHADAP